MTNPRYLSPLLSLIVACGGAATSDPSAPPEAATSMTDVESVSSGLASAEMAVDVTEVLDTAREIASALAQVSNFDASAIADTVDALRASYGCATITAAARAVTVDFHDGCEIRGRTYAGAFTVGVALDAAAERLTFTLDLADLSVDDASISGQAIFIAEKPGIRTLEVDVDFANETLVASVQSERIRVVDRQGAALDATATVDGALAGLPFEATYQAAGVERSRGECAPHAGTVEITYTLYIENPLYPRIGPERLEETHVTTITFTADSPVSGTAQVDVDGEVETVDIPSCQATPTDFSNQVRAKREDLANGSLGA